jgi:mRNA interferase RelE/StbE
MLPIFYENKAKKYFKKLKDKNLKKKFDDAIKEIRKDYTIGNMEIGDLSGIYCYDVYYNKTNYEIAYIIEELEDGTLLIILMAGPRENFYEELKKYLK